MGLIPSRPRRVLILGPDASIDIEPIARQAAVHGVELVLVSLGRRVTAAQAGVLRQALRLARERGSRLALEEVVAGTADEAVRLAGTARDVTVVASGSEQRRLERALAGRPNPAADTTCAAASGDPSMAPSSHDGTADARADRHPETHTAEAATRAGVVEAESVEALAGRTIPEPEVGTTWTWEQARARKRAPFRVYLAAAPGAGKTYAMLGEGQRRKARGTDVVVGTIYTYGRPRTIEMLQGLEVVPSRALAYRGASFEEIDVDAVIARRPQVVLIDELAHTNVPGSRRAKRWEDVLDVLATGITVISTVNVQHLESLNDVVGRVTGIRQQETVPDWVLDLADQVELVDISPYALQRRMLHGNIYPEPAKAELALQRFFTMEHLTALRELALLRVADQVDEELLRRWSKQGTPDTRERVLVCVSRPTVAESLVRRGARIAKRTRGDLVVVHATGGEEGAGPDPEWERQMRQLVADLGGEFRLLEGDNPVDAVLAFAYRQHVTQIVVGESLRPRWRELLHGSFVNRLIRKAANIDVHVMARAAR